jgi:CRISPR-associated protein Cas2
MYYLVCFDIVDNRDRRKVVKIIRGYGYRVQKSVFECPGLTERKFLTLRNRLEEIIDNISDTVRFYRLCKGCIESVEVVGVGGQPETAAVRVV